MCNHSKTLFSKHYLKQFLAKELCDNTQTYQAIYFSITGIKSSNTAFGHNFTDSRIDLTRDILTKAFSQKRQYTNELFETNINDSFLLDMGGGNYLSLIPKDMSISQEELDEITESVNSHASLSDSNSTFKISSCIEDKIDTRDTTLFKEAIKELKHRCNIKKDELKKESFSSIDISVSFKKIIEEAVSYYKKIITNSDSPENQKIFFINFFRSFLNYACKHNENVDDLLASKDFATYPSSKGTATSSDLKSDDNILI